MDIQLIGPDWELPDWELMVFGRIRRCSIHLLWLKRRGVLRRVDRHFH